MGVRSVLPSMTRYRQTCRTSQESLLRPSHYLLLVESWKQRYFLKLFPALHGSLSQNRHRRSSATLLAFRSPRTLLEIPIRCRNAQQLQSSVSYSIPTLGLSSTARWPSGLRRQLKVVSLPIRWSERAWVQIPLSSLSLLLVTCILLLYSEGGGMGRKNRGFVIFGRGILCGLWTLFFFFCVRGL
jgi:hypothetical protein